MTFRLAPCPVKGCDRMHGVITSSRRTSRPAPTDSVSLGTGGDASTLIEAPDGRLGAGVKAPRRQPVAPLRAGGTSSAETPRTGVDVLASRTPPADPASTPVQAASTLASRSRGAS